MIDELAGGQITGNTGRADKLELRIDILRTDTNTVIVVGQINRTASRRPTATYPGLIGAAGESPCSRIP